MSSLQRDIKELYKKLASKSFLRTNLISTQFPVSSHEKETHWFHSPNVFLNSRIEPSKREPIPNLWFPKDILFWKRKDSPLMFFSTPWISLQKPPTLSQNPLFWFFKIHILKLWTSPKDPKSLVSKYPNTSLIWFPWDSPSLLNKWAKGCLYSVQIQAKSCHNFP